METLLYPDKRLTQVSETVEFFTDELEEFATALLDHCKANNGLGMAAPQVGRFIRLIVIDNESERISKPFPQFLVNPVIHNPDGESRYKEGCLSVPGIYAWVKRPACFGLTYQTLLGEKKTIELVDANKHLFGTVIQHEIDHLNGIEFIDRLNSFEKNKIIGQLNKRRKRRK